MRRQLLAAVLAALLFAPAGEAWTWPAAGPVLQAFLFDPAHPYAAGQHRGVDIGGEPGATVLAPGAGTVTFAGTVPASGKSVTIATPDGYAVTVTHLGSITVGPGATVGEGDGVGTIGPSGEPEVALPYVHLGIRVDADPQGYLDPLTFLPARAATAAILVPPAVAEAPPPAPQPVVEPAPAPRAAPEAPSTTGAAPATAVPSDTPVAVAPVAVPAAAPQPLPVEPVPVGQGTAQPAAPGIVVRAAAPGPHGHGGRVRPGAFPAATHRIAVPPASVAVESRAAPSGFLAYRALNNRASDNRASDNRASDNRAMDNRATGNRAGERRASEDGALPTHTRHTSRSLDPVAADAHGRTGAAPVAHPTAGRRAASTGRAEVGARVGPFRPPVVFALLVGATLLAAAVLAGALISRRLRAVRMMGRCGTGTEEDPGRPGMALCGGSPSPWSRGGLRRPVRRVRPLSPAEGQRRPHGEWHRRARHAGDGGRRQGGQVLR
jgi:hypothetical protein